MGKKRNKNDCRVEREDNGNEEMNQSHYEANKG